MLFEIFVCIFLYLLIQFYIGRRHKHFPPGPFTWPMLGNMVQIGMEPHISLTKMKAKYGDIMAVDFGAKRSIVIQEYKLLRELFSLPVALARPEFNHFSDEETGKQKGFLFASGQLWNEQRRFTFSYIQSVIRDMNNREKLIAYEVEVLNEELKQNGETSMNTQTLYKLPAINALWTVIAGRRYSMNNEDFYDMIKRLEALMENPATIGIFCFFPKFSKTWPRLTGFRSFRIKMEPILEFMKNVVEEHKETYQEGIVRDFVDAYLQKIYSTTDTKSSFYGEEGEMNLKHCLFHLFIGGTETVAASMCWFIFLMAYFPEKQEKFLDTLREFKCRHKSGILLKDRGSLPYIEATIEEVLRFSALSPLSMFHEASENFEFHGYKIPKDTMIVANAYGMLHDPEVWEDPEDFKPERFLTEDGNGVIHHPGLTIFSVGRRSCPGESFARDEMFLFVTGLMDKFRLEFDPSAPIPLMKGVLRTVLCPAEHKIVFKEI